MLQTHVLTTLKKRPNGVLKMAAFGTLLGGGYGCYWHQMRKGVKQAQLERIGNEITQWTPYELKGREAVEYPWLRAHNIVDWEYRLVKVYGYFKDERAFVKRQRNGQDGYLVFAPFITAKTLHSHDED
jgi:surfeit locus 1 family protein